MGDMNLTRLVMAWIDRQGPFADDALTRNPDEYYTLENNDDPVTEDILGEVAARHFAERPTALVSFAPSHFTLSPLTIVWHRSDQERENGYLDNFWALSALHTFLEGLEEDVASWSEMLARAQARYTNLTFLEGMEQHLAGEPFSSTIARRALELLDILNQIKGSYTTAGKRSEKGEELIDNYFRRTNSFSDASDTEKNTTVYRAAMTFRLFDGTPLECFWHGKISHRFFRIHFSSIEADKPLYIAYIGPKRTKQ